MYGFLCNQWASLTAGQRLTWSAAAAARQLTPFNQFIGVNMARWATFKTPSKTTPIGVGTNPNALGTVVPTGAYHHTHWSTPASSPGSRWGIIVHRSTVNGFTAGITNVVRIWLQNSNAAKTFDDLNLTAGTYYYRLRLFSTDGFLTTVSIQRTLVVT